MVRLVQIAPEVSMPLFGLGTWRTAGAETVLKAVDVALSAGYRLFDTASFYENEKELGDAFKTLLPKYKLERKDIFVTTKLHPNVMGKTGTVDALKISLDELGLKCVDLFLIHYPKPFYFGNKDFEKNKEVRKKVWEEMELCLEQGLTRTIGISNYEVSHMKEMDSYARIKPAVNQIEFHPHFTRKDIVEYCKANGIHVQAYASLGRMDLALVDEPEVKAIAKEHDSNSANVLLAWAMALDVSVLPKSINPERIKGNWESVNLKLSVDNMAQLNKLNRNKPYTTCTPWDVL